MTWLAKHPILTGLAIVFGIGLLGTYPLLLIPALMAPAAWYGQQWWDRRTQAQVGHRRMLTAHADYEHWLTTIGHPAGTHGQYPPVS